MYGDRDIVSLLSRGGHGWSKLGHSANALAVPEIRRVRAVIARAARKDTQLRATEIFIDALLDESNDAALTSSWREAMNALADIVKYPFDATKRGKKLREIAKNPRVLAAWQTSAVASEELNEDVLALLVIDASEASIDALLPHFERALDDRDRLSSFEDVARYESAATAPLFARIRNQSATKRAASPVLALGEKFGLAKNGRFKLSVLLLAKKPVKRFTHDFVSLEFDSNEHPGFSVTRGQQTRTATSSSSWARGVKSTIERLPKTIVKVARDAKVEWNFDEVTTKPIGAAKAAPLLAWLRSSHF